MIMYGPFDSATGYMLLGSTLVLRNGTRESQGVAARAEELDMPAANASAAMNRTFKEREMLQFQCMELPCPKESKVESTWPRSLDDKTQACGAVHRRTQWKMGRKCSELP